ncbi:MAG TPA: hypothetical protein VFZ66_27330 [Herpetosiphonaceae bacterium]
MTSMQNTGSTATTRPQEDTVSADRVFQVEITATATVRQRRQIHAPTPEAAIALVVATAGDEVWEYLGVDDDSIDGTALSTDGADPTCSPAM